MTKIWHNNPTKDLLLLSTEERIFPVHDDLDHGLMLPWLLAGYVSAIRITIPDAYIQANSSLFILS